VLGRAQNEGLDEPILLPGLSIGVPTDLQVDPRLNRNDQRIVYVLRAPESTTPATPA